MLPTSNEGEFLCARPSFQFNLSFSCDGFRSYRLLPDELYREAAARIFCALPCVMADKTLLGIRRDAGIQRIVTTAKEINMPSGHEGKVAVFNKGSVLPCNIRQISIQADGVHTLDFWGVRKVSR